MTMWRDTCVGYYPVQPEVGMRGWSRPYIGGGMLTEIEDRVPITVIGIEGVVVRVRTDDGQEWTLATPQCDFGAVFDLGANRVHEGSPEGLAYMEGLYRKNEARLPKEAESTTRDMIRSSLDYVGWTLSLHGRDVGWTPTYWESQLEDPLSCH